jgi:hypothetical protein
LPPDDQLFLLGLTKVVARHVHFAAEHWPNVTSPTGPQEFDDARHRAMVSQSHGTHTTFFGFLNYLFNTGKAVKTTVRLARDAPLSPPATRAGD